MEKEQLVVVFQYNPFGLGVQGLFMILYGVASLSKDWTSLPNQSDLEIQDNSLHSNICLVMLRECMFKENFTGSHIAFNLITISM